MKNKNKNLIAIGFLLSIFLMSFVVSKTRVVDSVGENIYLYITDAYYGDFDGDHSEDDIRIKAILDANFQDEVLLFLYLDVTLPSGYVHTFSFQVEVEFEGSNKLTGLAVFQDMLIFCYSTYTFDPPTENGNGDPEAVISIT